MERAAVSVLVLLVLSVLPAGRTACPPGHRACRRGQCLAQESEYVCDGYEDCPSGTDESDCGWRCKAGAAPCDGRCRRAAYWCDGTPDCLDGSDEAHCSRGGGRRGQPCRGQAPPANTTRASKVFCDGRHDCPRGWDEQGCASALDCRGGAYFCVGLRGSPRCLHPRKRCDGVRHCRDGEDEWNCSAAGTAAERAVLQPTGSPGPTLAVPSTTPTPSTNPTRLPGLRPTPTRAASLVPLSASPSRPPVRGESVAPEPGRTQESELPATSAPAEVGSGAGVWAYLWKVLLFAVNVVIGVMLLRLRRFLWSCASKEAPSGSSGIDRAPSFVFVGSRSGRYGAHLRPALDLPLPDPPPPSPPPPATAAAHSRSEPMSPVYEDPCDLMKDVEGNDYAAVG